MIRVLVMVLDGAGATLGDHRTLLGTSPLYRDLVGHWQVGADQIQPAS